eukprot:TRINITY_DN37865_c0_g1_i1.p1 TRINITY_DN37865_c0_g1~~TRINITY_DN37865_c0_g1_i1.p1  ORF type:complete len:338 (+),score=67.81 TRINITY_DN37865_c0_g1_i1:72-1016(+)
MVLCELTAQASLSFLGIWGLLIFLTLISVFAFSGSVFYYYYAKPTYEKWRYKINPKYPSPQDIRLEIQQTLKGLVAAALCPALSLYLAQHNMSQAYCGVGERGWGYLIISFFVSWIVADFLEFAYHYMGHSFTAMWDVHKHHHRFYNASPFSVIADEPLDQLIRAMPMAVFPLIAPINMDMLFLQFAVFFYAYGVYLHWGYELEIIDAHHPVLNTSYQHNMHHSLSIMNKPYHCGFYIKLWDQLAGSVLDKCTCSKCAREKGERTVEAWEKVEKPDYSPLLSPKFWFSGDVPSNIASFLSPKHWFTGKASAKHA